LAVHVSMTTVQVARLSHQPADPSERKKARPVMEGDKQGGGDYGTFQGPPSVLSSEPYARHRGAYQVSFAVNFVLNSNWIGGYTHELIIWVSSLPFFFKKAVLIIKK
jgi:hypothetical protein